MGAGSMAYAVSGVCANTLLSSTRVNCIPLRRLVIHTRFASPFSNDFVGTFGCGKYAPFNVNGTQNVTPVIPPSTIMSHGPFYGTRPETVTDVVPPGGTPRPVDPNPKVLQNVWFDPSDLVPWNWRQLGIMSNFLASGPALQKFHMAIPIRRRLKKLSGLNNNNYQGRESWNFVDASLKIFNQSDWLGALHPAQHFWTNLGIDEPFTVTDYYEQSGSAPPAANLNQWRVPFCTPLAIRNQQGSIIGYYTGYTAIHYFSLAYVHFADATQKVCSPDQTATYKKVFLPEDYRVEVVPPATRPKIKHQNQLFQLETSIFMIAESVQGGPALQSPRIGTIRWWHYADPSVNPWPCDNYMNMFMSPTGQWKFGIRFNHYNNSEHTDILFGLPYLTSFVSP